MLIETLTTGDKLHKYHRCLVALFEGKRRVLSTSMHNGGYREDLTAIFNHDVNPGPGRLSEYMTQDEVSRKKFITEELGLNYDKVAYMATIVSMDNAVVKTLSYDELTVTAVATASVEVNSGRVGEKATSYEKRGKSVSLKPGTINIMVFINADMTPGCMARAMMTATEAKTAALQELLVGSLRSNGIATGTGTDNLIIIANAESDNLLTYAGKHGKLGELIGVTVMSAVKQSLKQHCNVTEESQHSMLARLKRFGITEAAFQNALAQSALSGNGATAAYLDRLHNIDKNPDIVTMTSLYVHLLDQLNWGLLEQKEAVSAGEVILKIIMPEYDCKQYTYEQSDGSNEVAISRLLKSFINAINALALLI